MSKSISTSARESLFQFPWGGAVWLDTHKRREHDALVAELSANLEDWRRTSGPTGAAGYLSFEASIFTEGAPGMSGSAQKPILRLEQLVLPMDQIDWSQN